MGVLQKLAAEARKYARSEPQALQFQVRH